jgi:hypothetical protein
VAKRKVSKPASPETTTDDNERDIAEPKTSRRRSPQRLSAAKSLPPPPASNDIEQWFFELLAARYSVPPGRVSRSHPLAQWGYANPNDLAFLAGEFNRVAHTRPHWNHATVTPPELIDAVFGETIEQLLAFLSRVVSAAVVSQQLPEQPTLETVRDTDFSTRIGVANNDTAIVKWIVDLLKRRYQNDKINMRWILPDAGFSFDNILLQFKSFVVTTLGISGYTLSAQQIGSAFAGKRLGSLVSYLQESVRASQLA